MTKTYIMNGLIEKMQSSDQDFRYMGLNDLMKEIEQDPNSFYGDETVEMKVLKQVMALVEDNISEVKNQAVKCLGKLTKILRENQLDLVIDKLIEFSAGKDEELRDISGLALKTITSELPADKSITSKACYKLAPKLVSQLSNTKASPEALIETLSILSILTSRFPTQLATANLNPAPLSAISPLLSHPRPAVRKRAIITLAQVVPISSPQLFTTLLQKDIIPFLAPGSNLDKQRTTVQLVTAVARHTPGQIAPSISQIVPGIVEAAKRDDEELRESCLQALEALVLRCPIEASPFVGNIIQVGNIYIKYDPNYAGDDDEDEEMEDEDEDDDMDEYAVIWYEDDEDTSYKIRRAATKLLAAVIGTRPDLLAALYKEVSPVLISRFGDREETVRLEVWATYNTLLHQTRVFGGVQPSKDIESVGGKRKRESEGMEVEETPSVLLRAQVPSLSKTLLNQLKSRKASPATLQSGFGMLSTLLLVLPGSLSNQIPVIASLSKNVFSQTSNNTGATLQLSCLTFLARLFSTHSPPTFSASLPTITPALLKSLAERHPRVASESFRVFSSLLNAMKPVKGNDWADRVYEESVQRLSNHDTDAEVRGCAEECIADLWICATDVVKSKDRKEWDYIRRTTGRTEGAVNVVTRVAKEVDVGDDWTSASIDWVMTLLKRGGRAGKPEAFTCLDALLRKYKSEVPRDLVSALVPQLKGFLATSDISLLSHSAATLTLLLQLSPSSTFPEVERDILKDVYGVAASPLVSGTALDSLLGFFGALVEADMEIATHVVPNLKITAEKAEDGEVSQANVAKCIAQVVKSQLAIAAGTIAEFSKNIKPASKAKPRQVVLSLLTLGECGRFIDMSNQQDIFTHAINHFGAEQEEIRTAAAFAAGKSQWLTLILRNIAIGNLHLFLPAIVKLVKSDPQKRLLSLHALKEVVSHTSHGQLETVADTLWTPLFENSENAEEATRNVAAACLGKLTTTHPSQYLPQLHARIRDVNPAARATVIAAIRYTFADASQSYDELLSPLLVDFLCLMQDPDLTVRRLALSALNSAARTKPHLVREHLAFIIPNLYSETVVKPELIRTVQMGPWTHKVDDGLDARKTAYETVYTLLDTCLPKLDINELLARVLSGLGDDSDEIKVICHMILFRLSQVAPTAVAQRLDEATPLLEKSVKGPNVTKDTVKQDVERAAELRRSTLRASAALSKISVSGLSPKFDAFIEVLQKSEWATEFRELVGA
ncbi:ARM repeat-containing protein [Punctularia strigosozonata HHB-11173 SS5]|uniref:ARM repeat-containing protein n=1 Tax=Punctularia strigosozonata (strain HHB-11173) TaxID=741275 RepID=UPI0004418158|nr:ARM repeat-containing protein [Punctularia strigosozonata HHB-11173 SS5]EIN13285.1 ARM repeat-containing protein [Punctularia strigosozonata HHB-11173 SS5]